MKYLSEDEQYKDVLNHAEIERIRDPELRKMRRSFWLERHALFQDEHNVSDAEFGTSFNESLDKEKKAISEYRLKKSQL